MLKSIIKKIVKDSGYDIVRRQSTPPIPDPGSDQRPVGNMKFFLEDLRKRGLRCKSKMDVGANRTNWSRMAHAVFPEARFSLIEPQLEMKDDLDRFCRDFPETSVFPAGAGSKNDKLILTIWDDLDGSSFLPKEDAGLKNSGKQREVDIITIDSLIESDQIKIPELMKLDIQGFELEALKGAEKTFGHTEVYILEVSLFSFSDVPGQPVLSDVVNFMLSRNYVVYDFPGFLRRPLDGALGQCDICFVRKDGFLRKSSDWK